MLTENFVNSGFSLNGLYANIRGNSKSLMIYEFPIYNFVVGLVFLAISYSPVWGKLVSFIASAITLLFLHRMIRQYYNEKLALAASAFFVFSPISTLMRTSFQPDAMGLMFLVVSVYYLLKWTENRKVVTFIGSCVSLLFSGLAKFPIIVPYGLFIISIFFFEQGRLRFPKYYEVLLVGFICIVPVVGWYLFARDLSDPAFLQDPSSMFLFGDLTRFTDATYYLQPAFFYTFYVFSAVGIIFLLASLKDTKPIEITVLVGIPLYLIVVPTSSVQHYYHYAITPIAALFMAKGFLILWDSSLFRTHKAILFSSLALYLVMFLISTQYLLRQDNVFQSAAARLNESTRDTDIILSLALHDRVYVRAANYTEMAYLSKRKCWNLLYGRGIAWEDLKKQIDEYRDRGAKYIVVTWYSSDLEPWFVKYIPQRFARNPNVDGKSIFASLKNHYSPVSEGKNFGIVRIE